MPNWSRVARFGQVCFTTLVRALLISATISLGACTYDESEGTFNLVAKGGIETVSHGRVRAHQETGVENRGSYYIALDVGNASPPLAGFTNFLISTRERPTGSARFVYTSESPSNAKRTAWIGLATPSGASVEWLADSGSVDFKQTPGRHAVAGEFIAYLSCPRCGPGNTQSHTVLLGNFETRE